MVINIGGNFFHLTSLYLCIFALCCTYLLYIYKISLFAFVFGIKPFHLFVSYTDLRNCPKESKIVDTFYLLW